MNHATKTQVSSPVIVSTEIDTLSGKVQEGPLDAAFSKKPRTTEAICDEAHLTEQEISALSHEELVQTVIVLQQALAKAQAAPAPVLAPTSGNAALNWTPEKIAAKAESISLLVNKEIKKQMKWQPSCKQGKTKWSYQGMVPCREVFDEIFSNEKDAKKQWKMKKFSRVEFEDIFGYVEASVSDLVVLLSMLP